VNTELIGAEAWYRIYGPLLSRRCRSLWSREKQALGLMQDIFTRIRRGTAARAAGASRSPLCGLATNG